MAAYHDMGEAIIGDITPSDGVSKGNFDVLLNFRIEPEKQQKTNTFVNA